MAERPVRGKNPGPVTTVTEVAAPPLGTTVAGPEGTGGPRLSVRPMGPDEIGHMVDYFHDADDGFLEVLGADRKRFPGRDQWQALVRDDMDRPLTDREFHYLIWELDGRAVGHCNINQIEFGRHAFLHLHLWDESTRGQGVGTRLLADSVSRFCALFELDVVYSEPHARNPAPNATMAAVGFELERTYETTPGWINVRQRVNRWRFRCGARPVQG